MYGIDTSLIKAEPVTTMVIQLYVRMAVQKIQRITNLMGPYCENLPIEPACFTFR